MPKFNSSTPLPRLKALYMKARDLYYNSLSGKTLMSDDEFDDLEDRIRELDPKWEGLKSTGIKTKKSKQPLLMPMPSLDKVKADSVDKWLESLTSSDAVVSDKLDGSSLQLKYVDGVPRRLLTRGDGITGGDISFLIPHLKIPQSLGKQSVLLRCEGLFSKSAFLKYKAEFDAARNAASGIFNRQDVHPATKDLTIVVLRVMDPAIKPQRGLAWAKAKGFAVVPHVIVPVSKLNATSLSKLLEKRKAVSKFHLDGLVIEQNTINKVTKDRPKWAKAFKANQTAESAPVTTVRSVIWDVSHRGQVIPRVEFDPVVFDGAKVRFASAFNAKYVRENGIGVGAKLAILRSGEIIPYIAKIIKPVKPAVPDVKLVGEYTLDSRGTNYVLSKPQDSEEFRIQRLLKFFGTLEVDFIKVGTIRKLYAEGLTNVKSWVDATPKKLMSLGLTEATATKLYDSFQSKISKGVPLIQLMDASGTFPHGIGQTRFERVQEYYDLNRLLTKSSDEQRQILSNIPGFGASVTEGFVRGAPKFVKWVSVVGLEYKKPAKAKKVTGPLNGVKVTWTGYRNKDEESVVVSQGGQVVPFGGKTTVLLVSPSGKASSKQASAESKGIPVMTWDKFSRKYKL